MPQFALDSTLGRLTPTTDRDQVDRDLADFFSEARRCDAGNPHVRPLYDQITDFVLRGGKRLRPRLCLAGYRIITGSYGPPPRPIARAAASLEVFHAFMLVHDDLIDGSILRRGKATLHEAIRRGDDQRHRKQAADLGLIGGDLLFALGMRLLNRAGLDDAASARAGRLMADMLFETGLGEALDVLYDDCPLDDLSEGQIIESYLRKTARYSVSGPLVLGATLAGASPAALKAIDRFGDLLGFSFQVQNDLDALEVDPALDDQPDLDGGKRTYVLWAAYQGLTPSGRRDLVAALDAPVGLERRKALLGLIADAGAVEICRARIEQARAEAIGVLETSPIDARQRYDLISLMGLFGDSYGPPIDFPGFVIEGMDSMTGAAEGRMVDA
ncbi:polyprenyl synthetase family protein [Tundrisphaera sp. TA3]|uniref:polyprenyl synthetase family protein n=1 Tax=Tundrisphaera sp. TA3 TaxID=3435775 RepID=UPI003EC0A7CA